MNGAFAEESIDAPDEICYNITNPSEGRNDQAQFEPPLRRVAERKRVPVRWDRRKISHCALLVSGFLRAVYRFPYLQTWLGSS